MEEQKFIQDARKMVAKYHNENVVNENIQTLDPSEIYIVWFSKTLQNAKGLLSTPTSDGMYYEVTYNGNQDVYYFDAYKKQFNQAISMNF